MHPNAISVLAAFLIVGDLHFGVAQDASEAHVDRPRWNFPREVERTSRKNTQKNTHSDPGLLPNGLLDNLMQTHGSSSQPAVIPTPESSPAIQTRKGREIVGVTISVDYKSPKFSHLAIDSTNISGEPGATTAITTKTESSSSRNILKENSTAASINAETIIKEEWTVESSPNMSTRAASTTSATSSTDNLPHDLAAGLENLIEGSTSSFTSSTASTVTSAAESPTMASTSLASTKLTNLSTAIFDNLRSSLDILLGSPTSSFVSVASKGSGFSSADSADSPNSANSADSSKISGLNAASSTAKIAGLDHPDHLGLGDNSSTENSITATLFTATSSQSSIPVNVSVSTTSSLSTTSTLIGTSTSSNLLDGLISGLDSQYGVTPSGAGSTALFTTVSVPNTSLSQSKMTSLAPSLGLGGSTTVLIPTSTNSIGTVHISYSPSLDFTSASGTKASTGMESSTGTKVSTGMESSTGTKASTGTEPSTGTETRTGMESSTGTKASTGMESSTGTKAGTGMESSTGTKVSTGIRASTGMESSTGTETSTGTKASAGMETSTGTETRTGMESSTGTETRTGMETSTGTETRTGTETSTGTVSGPSSLLTPTPEVLTLSYHSFFTPLPTFTLEVSTAKSSEEPQSTQSATSAPLTSNNDWMPSTILIVPTFTATVSSISDHANKPKATSLPGSITPSNEITEAPSDSVLLQLGFDNQLPWSFVINTPLSSSQIFNYTPQAIENALPSLSSKDSPVMFSLEPYYSWHSTGYNATLAIFYFPRDKVDLLRAVKVNPNSALYNQASESIQSLMSKVDPKIPLDFYGNYPSGVGDSTGGGSDGDSEGGSDSRSDGGTTNNDGSASSSKTNSSSIGIGVGVVASAAAYGAGMFWVARRYRKRKQLHQHSHLTSKQVNQGSSAPGPIPAAGGRAHGQGSRGTARSQTISGPVMVENSLGWD
ncbi:hypothetical protein VN97_g9056 [Penicillium thymicola]|uniref:Uncharacterized protein n=1 Tax=Penicillium thymicola TaxID=293382 RepID=A0AAI9TD25_PENTH|nr:hypothetical protein VN97_g9056 [Penicillium thymicola]